MDYRTKCLIIGSGAAGCTAAIYTARANLKPILLCGNMLGGQLATTNDVENYPGFISINGGELMDKMREQAVHCGAEVIQDHLTSVDFSERPFTLKSGKNTYVADTVVIATGAQALWLGLKAEEEYRGFGVSACATCDGPFFRNKTVAVVGGGNSAITEALYLSTLAKRVHLIVRGDKIKCEKVLQDKLASNDKIETIFHSNVVDILGGEDALGKFVKGVLVKNSQTGEENKISVDGVFIAIGHKPCTDLFKGQIDLDEKGYIITDPRTGATSVEGVFAAGDVQDDAHKQCVVAAGMGCVVALEIEKLLND
ncbi:MAG: thioredoxin-disulfide reductase [Rickettsiales bacterium]|nr:thioredoxin-disulfide reductase [Rickettsiales bacterium]